jgi:hypothetical protein
MEEALLLVQAYRVWIYLALALAALVYLRLGLRRYRGRQDAVFGLERERADREMKRAAGMLALVVGTSVLTFIVSTFLAPAVPAASRPTQIPTVSLLATAPTAPGTDFAAASPIPPAQLDRAGCQNPLATLTSPQEGASLAGLVAITGTANTENFAFFKYEYIPISGGAPSPEAVWRAVSAGTQPVVEGELGGWDTSLVTPGDYAFRLVVTDTAGNAPLPCVVTVYILPSG